MLSFLSYFRKIHVNPHQKVDIGILVGVLAGMGIIVTVGKMFLSLKVAILAAGAAATGLGGSGQ